MLKVKNGIIPVDFYGRILPFHETVTNIEKKTAMRYSAAYPMGAERCLVASFGLAGFNAK